MVDPRMPPQQPPRPAAPATPAPARPANADQDPNNPANKTQPKDMRPLAERDRIDGPVFTSDNLRTEQEKDASGKSMGVGPMTPPEVRPEPAETVQEQGIGPRTPYPTGNPPPPSEVTIIGQGIKGVTDKPTDKPGEVKGPGAAAAARKEPVR